MFKRWFKSGLEELGLYVKWRRNLPRCADWLVDVDRCLQGRGVRVAFDVGANVGQTTRLILGRFPCAQIHAFEPVSSTFDLLKANVGRLESVRCHQIALSDHEGSLTIPVVPGSVFNSLESKLLVGDRQAVQEEVALTTLDHFLAREGVRTIDVLKTDTEGHDLKVLQGASEILSRGGVGCVYTEITFSAENSHNTPFMPVFDLLRGWGYRFMGLYEMHYFQVHPWEQSFCNALFVRQELVDAAARNV